MIGWVRLQGRCFVKKKMDEETDSVGYLPSVRVVFLSLSPFFFFFSHFVFRITYVGLSERGTTRSLAIYRRKTRNYGQCRPSKKTQKKTKHRIGMRLFNDTYPLMSLKSCKISNINPEISRIREDYVTTTIFVWDFPHFVIASDIYLFIYLCTRAQRLSRGFYLACRLGSTSNREDVFVLRPLVDYTYQLLIFFLANFDFFFAIRRESSALRLSVWDTHCCIYFWQALYYKVGKDSLSVLGESLEWIRNNYNHIKFQFSDNTFFLKLCHTEIALISWKSRQFLRKMKS